ncbi:thioesterase II family protein [Streptomyces sp. NPDC050504]|uniref:thioesterase II family protein n=1 Tax=Streptomyces sp. NPDC050504 TaxID=3365618 RepID=UPI0037892CDD
MDSTWFRRFTADTGNGTRLVCFPHAGGSATAYAPLAHALSADFDVVAVQYPGRQERYAEEPFAAMAPLVEAVAGQLAGGLAADPGRPYALFGHSMGALVAFETARLLDRDGPAAPRRLFLSGRGAPSVRAGVRHAPRGDAELVAEVRGLGGTDQSLLDDPDVLEMVLPALRADYLALATYRWDGGAPLAAPITALVGESDPMVPVDEVRGWRERTSGDFSLQVFPGGHFYLADDVDRVAAAVTGGLLADATAP